MQVTRKTVRKAITALLETIPGVTVYESRIYPLSTLPALSVYTLEESVDDELFNQGETDHRIINLTIEINDKASSEIDDSLDDLSYLVEEKIKTDPTLGGVVDCMNYIGTNIELSGESDQPVGMASLNYIALT